MAPPFKPSFWSLLPLSNYFKCGTFIQAHYFNVISSLKHRSRSFFQAHDVFQDLSFKPKTFVKPIISSLKHCSNSLSFKPKTYFKIVHFKPKTFFKPIISSYFQVWNIVQALSFKPKTYFKIVLSNPRPFSSFLLQAPRHIWRSFFQAQNLFQAHFSKSFHAHPLLSLQASHMHKKWEVPIQNSHRNRCISKVSPWVFFPLAMCLGWVDCTPCFEWTKGSHPDFCLLICFYCDKS